MIEAMRPGLASGTVVIDCSTVGAMTALQAAETLSHSGVGFLDCPVSGGTEGAVAGTLSIMVGGAADDMYDIA